MAELAGWELRTGRAHLDFHLETLARLDEARAAVAAVLTADVDQIALTSSTSHGLGLATWAADWRPGDRAVTTTAEHAGALGPLYALRDRFAVDLAYADIGDGGDDERTLAAFDAAVVTGHPAGVRLPRLVGHRCGAAGGSHRRGWLDRAAPSSSSTVPRRPAPSRSMSRRWASTSTRSHRRSGSSDRRASRRCGCRRRCSIGHGSACPPTSATRGMTRGAVPTRGPAPVASTRRTGTSPRSSASPAASAG